MGARNRFRSLARRFLIRPAVVRLRSYLGEFDEGPTMPLEVELDNTYAWLQYAFCELMRDSICAQKPMYVWGVIQGAALAVALGIDHISTVEFGVAMGAGLKSLEHTVEIVEKKTKLEIDVYGFDTGAGLPKPKDCRDQPNMWVEGQLPMNRDLLTQKLQKAGLRLGLVSDTLAQFLRERLPPVAFVAFDLDLYSSTKDALLLLSAEHDRMLPRVICYFDDIMGHTYSDFTGERLAISEFNDSHETRKLSPIYDLRYFVPGQYRAEMCWDCLYFAHIFDHPLYNIPDSLRKTVYADGNIGIRMPVSSDWRDLDLFEFATKNKVEGKVLYLNPQPNELKRNAEKNKSSSPNSPHRGH